MGIVEQGQGDIFWSQDPPQIVSWLLAVDYSFCLFLLTASDTFGLIPFAILDFFLSSINDMIDFICSFQEPDAQSILLFNDQVSNR